MNNVSDASNNSEDDKKSKQRDIQMEITILEADAKKFIAEKSQLEAGMRELKKDEARIRVNLEEKRSQYEKISQEIAQNEEEVKRLRKKLNLL